MPPEIWVTSSILVQNFPIIFIKKICEITTATTSFTIKVSSITYIEILDSPLHVCVIEDDGSFH